jgi:pristinamycin I synthase-3/4
LAAQLVARVRDAFDVELPITAVFEARTVARLCARVGAREHGVPAQAPIPRRVATASNESVTR